MLLLLNVQLVPDAAPIGCGVKFDVRAPIFLIVAAGKRSSIAELEPGSGGAS